MYGFQVIMTVKLKFLEVQSLSEFYLIMINCRLWLADKKKNVQYHACWNAHFWPDSRKNWGHLYYPRKLEHYGLERHPRKKWHYAENYAQNLNIVFKVITQYNIKAPRTLNLPFHSHHFLKQVKLAKNKRLTELYNVSLIWIKFPQCR